MFSFFFSSSPIHLPPWFVKVKECRLTKSLFWKTLHHTSEVFQITKPQISWMNYSKSDIKKPDDKPKFASKLLQLALMLRYSWLPACLCEYIICVSDRHERVAAENVMKFNDLPQSFLSDNHLENKLIYRSVCKIFFINAQKLVNSKVRTEVIQQFKEKAKEATTHMIGIKFCDYSIV